MREDDNIKTYKHLYMEYAPRLIRFAEKFVSGFAAEDIVQDVFLRMWDKRLPSLPEEDARRLLFVATRNACLDWLRRETLEREVMDERAEQLRREELDYFEAADELFMRRDLLRLLMSRVEELPERSRAVFRMSYMEGLKAAEIAEQTGVSVRTVENQLYRALAYLRQHCTDLQWAILVSWAFPTGI